ncbi:hypothetical protein V1478_008689 [Vespula squamosa]|uniref:Uncharacterized protein n=1 Tax=Vespula squamosa TaxID=30214 RepID=A0ABD2AUX5_VESSQ
MPRQRKALKAFARAKTTGSCYGITTAKRNRGKTGPLPLHHLHFLHRRGCEPQNWEQRCLVAFRASLPLLHPLGTHSWRTPAKDDLTFCGRPKARRTLPLLVWDSENSESSTSNDVHVDQLP